MQVKLLLFDLDGVLVDTLDYHRQALNKALGPDWEIPYHEYWRYDGKKTLDKLKLHTDLKGFPTNLYQQVQSAKHMYYMELIQNLKPSKAIKFELERLSYKYILGVCSNSTRECVETCLKKADIMDYFSVILSSDDVSKPKPDAEIYETAMRMVKVDPDDTVIFEDSPQGIKAAEDSGAIVMMVRNINHTKRILKAVE